ncbi:MAG: LysE family transporter [Euryarchaeota archaeon]|nr:LysE family translocator [Euryarchaeota archaeon]MBT7244299.1 LysE family translocator [Euryarchaeota archaeon]NCF97051.1 LysE family transporter [Euryarchaeota archaeon]
MDITAISAAAVMFILGATSPGPSLAVVLRNTMIGGRSRGLACAVGHGIGFGFYAVSVVFGLVAIMENNPNLFTIMQILGGLFLLYLGIEIIRSEEKEIEHSEGKREGFVEGFFIAFLNPKIAVFMLAVLSSVLDPSMSSDTKWIIAGMGMTIDTVWYVLVALILSNSSMLTKIENNQRLLNQITGVLMIGLAIWTAYKLSGL